MKKVFTFLIFIVIVQTDLLAWYGMPTPALHVEGNKLKDPTGKDVVLHGWMQPTSNWFNGAGRWYSDPKDWNSTSDIAPFLDYLKNAATLLSDTSPKYSQSHGWYTSFVRLNTDAIGGWTSESGLVDSVQFDGWIKNFIVPYANFLSSRGLYLVLSAVGPINTPNNGSHNAGVTEQKRLRKFWSTVAGYPGVKNAGNIMFELMNEPVDVESAPGNGDWGNHQDKYYSAFTQWIQPIIDDIRKTGSNNIVWVPTLEWQGTPHQWAKYPFSGTNIGVACHYYPAYGGVFNNATSVQNLWDLQYKPAADKWPMIITELFWTPYPNDPMNLVNGTTVGFGNAIHKAIDNQGNVSYIVGFIADLLENLNESMPSDCHISPREGASAYFTWLPNYKTLGPDDGTPKQGYASVTSTNSKQIKLEISQPAQILNSYKGFAVAVNNQAAAVDSVKLSSPKTLCIYLNSNIKANDDIKLSYSNGDVVSIYGKNLSDFSSVNVDNLLKGTYPKLTELTTNIKGDTLKAKFNKKMLIPADLSKLALTASFNGNKSIQILKSELQKNDSTTMLFALGEKVYADYQLSLSYTGNNIVSSDSSLLQSLSNKVVTNNSIGLPVVLSSGKLEANGTSVVLTFSKPLAVLPAQSGSFTLKVKGVSQTFNNFYMLDNTIRFTLSSNLHSDDVATISYTPGGVTSVDLGPLNQISNYQISNMMTPSIWVTIPNRIQAEDFSLQSGVQTENTNDSGGGLDVGWIDNGDWMEYAVDNSSSTTSFKASFRVGSPNSNGRMDIYVDGNLVSQLLVPNTGGWQNWQSITTNVPIAKGRHYLKVIATTGGYNINYVDVSSATSAMEESSDKTFVVYPNPVSDKLTIRTNNASYSKIEIMDMNGATVLSKQITQSEPIMHFDIDLSNGVYIVKMSNQNEFVYKKIIVKRN